MTILLFTYSASFSSDEYVMASLVLWMLVTAAVLALAVWRAELALRDHWIVKAHPLNGSVKHFKVQGKIGTVDRWGQALTIAAVTFGIGLILLLAYRIWAEGIRILEELIKLL